MIVAIEGSDQAGKLTQSTMLARALEKRRIKAKIFHFPDYGTPIGKEIRRYLDGKRNFSPQAIHCLLAANRWEKLDEIKSAQSKNSVLIMNRYCHSNLVYGIANGIGPRWLENLERGIPRADLTILLDVSPTESFKRQKTDRDVFEKNKKFLKTVSTTYRTVAKKKRWKVIDASGSKEDVHLEILKAFSKKARL